MNSVTYFWGLCTCSTQNDALLRRYEWKSFPKTGIVWILQVKSFLSWKLLFFFVKKLASILPYQQNEWTWLTQVQLHGNFQSFVTLKFKQVRNRSIDVVSFIMKNCFPSIVSGSFSSSGKMAFWRALESFLEMQLEDGEDVEVGLGEGKGKDRHWGGSGGFWRQQEAVRASLWAWPKLSLCAFHCPPSLTYFPHFLWQFLCSNNWLRW